MSGFFGFDSTLPERRGPQATYQNAPPQSTFHQAQQVDMMGAGATEDIAVYTWGTEEYDGLGDALMEGGDEDNDLTFGDEPIGTDFRFSHQQPAAQKQPAKSRSSKKSADLFASTEADFFSAPKKSGSRLRSKDQPKPTNEPRLRTMEEIEAEQLLLLQSRAPPAPPAAAVQGRPMTMEELERQLMPPPPAQPQAQATQAPLTMEEIERGMMGLGRAPAPPQQQQFPPPGVGFPPAPPAQAQQSMSSQDLQNLMFPPLGSQPPLPAQRFAAGAQQGGEEMGEEEMRKELERKIMETEMAEAKRRRKALKIAGMSRYNDIMTGGDKEFITRIQLSQLVTSDPYASDFYAQVFSAVARAKLAASGVPVAPDQSGPSVLQVGSDGKGLAVGVKRQQGGRLRDSAMNRMTMQVKRIVDNAKNRSGGKVDSASLQGVLGKTVLRPSTAGPRPALQVTSTPSLTSLLNPSNASQPHTGRRAPLTNKQVLLRLESLYETVMELEQLRRTQPPPPPTEAQAREFGMDVEQVEYRTVMAQEWSRIYQQGTEKLWRLMMVQEPLEISNPHPFISLLTPIKGHRIFGRCLRNFSPSQNLTVLILLLACYPQLDVVRAPPLPFSTPAVGAAAAAEKKREVATESFLAGVVPVIVGIVGKLDLKMIAGLVSLCGDRWDVAAVMSTRPGVALFTILLSRAEMLKHIPAGGPPDQQAPTPADIEQWNTAYLNLIRQILPRLPAIFPSTQAQAAAFGPEVYLMGSEGTDEKMGMLVDNLDGEVWGLIAAMALHAQPDEQTALVSGLREKIMHTVQSVKRGRVSEARGNIRLRNVNLFLNGLGLDAGMIDA